MSKVKITIMIPEDLDNIVEECCDKYFMSKSGFITMAVYKLIENLGNKSDESNS